MNRSFSNIEYQRSAAALRPAVEVHSQREGFILPDHAALSASR
jgi:hypothetical protein